MRNTLVNKKISFELEANDCENFGFCGTGTYVKHQGIRLLKQLLGRRDTSNFRRYVIWDSMGPPEESSYVLVRQRIRQTLRI